MVPAALRHADFYLCWVRRVLRLFDRIPFAMAAESREQTTTARRRSDGRWQCAPQLCNRAETNVLGQGMQFSSKTLRTHIIHCDCAEQRAQVQRRVTMKGGFSLGIHVSPASFFTVECRPITYRRRFAFVFEGNAKYVLGLIVRHNRIRCNTKRAVLPQAGAVLTCGLQSST